MNMSAMAKGSKHMKMLDAIKSTFHHLISMTNPAGSGCMQPQVEQAKLLNMHIKKWINTKKSGKLSRNFWSFLIICENLFAF